MQPNFPLADFCKALMDATLMKIFSSCSSPAYVSSMNSGLIFCLLSQFRDVKCQLLQYGQRYQDSSTPHLCICSSATAFACHSLAYFSFELQHLSMSAALSQSSRIFSCILDSCILSCECALLFLLLRICFWRIIAALRHHICNNN